MNHGLRSAHRVAAGFIAIAAPATLAVAIVSRRSTPPSVALSVEGAPVATIEATGGQASAWRGLEAMSRVGTDAHGRLLVEISPLRQSGAPDVMVYWAPEEPADRLPDGAILLGAHDETGSRAFALPIPAQNRPGFLVAFSLGHGEVIGSSQIYPSSHRGIDP
jgi:hypothetical protein